jgi:hypothetical protein
VKYRLVKPETCIQSVLNEAASRGRFAAEA